jgi:polysaccharide biosynthesis/export protein
MRLLGDSVNGVMHPILLTVRRAAGWPNRGLVLFLALFFCSQASFCQDKYETSQQTNSRIEQLASSARAHPVDTPVGPGDILHIEVFDVAELTRDVRVSDTGEISFPLIPGRIQAAGLTPFQLQSKLEQLLLENGLLSHPQVSVFVKEQYSQPVSVVGAVSKPMIYQVVRPTTLLEVLADAGGIAQDAGSVVIITRPTLPGAGPYVADASSVTPPAETQTITIHIQDLLESGNPSFNIPIFGGDVISIPRSGIIYVTGAGVTQPGGYVLQGHGDQITVLKAVALARGLTGYAKADDAVIFRYNQQTGKKEPIPVHIKKIQNNKTEDVAMKADDVLYVPDNVGKKVLVKGTEAAIGIGSAVAVYRVGNP